MVALVDAQTPQISRLENENTNLKQDKDALQEEVETAEKQSNSLRTFSIVCSVSLVIAIGVVATLLYLWCKRKKPKDVEEANQVDTSYERTPLRGDDRDVATVHPNTNVCHMLRMFFVSDIKPSEHTKIFKSTREALSNGICPNAQVIRTGNRRVNIEM